MGEEENIDVLRSMVTFDPYENKTSRFKVKPRSVRLEKASEYDWRPLQRPLLGTFKQSGRKEINNKKERKPTSRHYHKKERLEVSDNRMISNRQAYGRVLKATPFTQERNIMEQMSRMKVVPWKLMFFQ